MNQCNEIAITSILKQMFPESSQYVMPFIKSGLAEIETYLDLVLFPLCTPRKFKVILFHSLNVYRFVVQEPLQTTTHLINKK